MDPQRAQDRLDRFVAAWMSYDPDEVAAFFSHGPVVLTEYDARRPPPVDG